MGTIKNRMDGSDGTFEECRRLDVVVVAVLNIRHLLEVHFLIRLRQRRLVLTLILLEVLAVVRVGVAMLRAKRISALTRELLREADLFATLPTAMLLLLHLTRWLRGLLAISICRCSNRDIGLFGLCVYRLGVLGVLGV